MWLVALVVAAAQGAGACKFKPDPRPIETRLAERPLAFVGVVQGVSDKDDTVLFSIESPIRGVKAGQKTAEVPLNKTSCGLEFKKGQRWLFAGNDQMSLSAPLAAGRSYLRPAPEAELDIPKDWRACSAPEDCAVVFYGCSGRAAVSKAKRGESEKKAWAKRGDPRTLNCAVKQGRGSKNLILPEPYCREGACVIMEAVLPLDPF